MHACIIWILATFSLKETVFVKESGAVVSRDFVCSTVAIVVVLNEWRDFPLVSGMHIRAHVYQVFVDFVLVLLAVVFV